MSSSQGPGVREAGVEDINASTPISIVGDPTLTNLHYQLGKQCRPGLSHGLTCGVGVSVSDRERPLVTGVNGLLMAGEPRSGLRLSSCPNPSRPPR